MKKTIKNKIKDFALKFDIASIEENETQKPYVDNLADTHGIYMAESMEEIYAIKDEEKSQLRNISIHTVYMHLFLKLACKHISAMAPGDAQADRMTNNANNFIKEMVSAYRKEIDEGVFDED